MVQEFEIWIFQENLYSVHHTCVKNERLLKEYAGNFHESLRFELSLENSKIK